MIRTLAILLALASPALADELAVPVPSKAKQLAEQGRALYEAGDYASAIAAYDEAYALAPRPGLLFNLAQAYRRSGDCNDAVVMYRRFIEMSPDGPSRDVAALNLAIVQACDHGGVELVGPAPPLPPPPPPPTSQAPAPTSTKRRVGTYMALAGVGVLAVAGAFAAGAYEASDRVSDAYASGTATPNLSQDDARGRRDATIATACGVVGGTAAIMGAILYGLGRRQEPSHVAIAPSLHGGEVRFSWAF